MLKSPVSKFCGEGKEQRGSKWVSTQKQGARSRENLQMDVRGTASADQSDKVRTPAHAERELSKVQLPIASHFSGHD